MLSDRHAKLLEQRGVNPEVAAQYGVESSGRLGADCIAIPYLVDGQVVNRKYRTLGERKEFTQDKDSLKCLWNFDVLRDKSTRQPPIIFEGEMDALIAIQCGYVRSTSVPDGAPATEQGADYHGPKYDYLEHAREALKDENEIILACDSDAAGVNLLNDLAIRLGRARCKWVKYPKSCKDLNEVFNLYGERGVHETLKRAQYMKIDGIYRMSELPPLPEQPVHLLGHPIIDRHYRLRCGDFHVVTGIPSHGKSSWLNFVCCTAARRFGWTTAFASFEQRPQSDHRRNLRSWFQQKRVIDQSSQELDSADLWIDRHFSFICPNEDDDVTLEWFFERAAAAVIRHNAKIVVVDPWNEMDHDRARDQSITEYTGEAIKALRRFAWKYQVLLIVAAHPVKQKKNEDGFFAVPTLYDISDSAHWYNKADVGVVVHRLDPSRTLIRIAKVRYKGTERDKLGDEGDMEAWFTRETGSYQFIDKGEEAEANG